MARTSTSSRKRTRTRKPRDIYQEVTDRIVAALEQGVAPWVCPWSRDSCGDGGRPRNGSSGHVYRGINVFLTGMSGFASSHWFTFNQAKALGAHVHKGEKGTQVIYWRFIEAKGADNAADEQDDGDKAARRIPILRCYTVFNAEQVEWPEGSKHAPKLVVEHPVVDMEEHEEARGFVEGVGADIRHGGTRAYFSPQADYIRVPEPARFSSTNDYFSTVLHELAHWTGHDSRIGRDLTGRFGSESYAADELVAEMAAAFLCADLAVPGKLQHAEYIGSWIEVLESDKRAVFTAARMGQEAADYLIGLAHQEDASIAQDGREAA